MKPQTLRFAQCLPGDEAESTCPEAAPNFTILVPRKTQEAPKTIGRCGSPRASPLSPVAATAGRPIPARGVSGSPTPSISRPPTH